MAILDTTSYAFYGEIKKDEICERVDNFGGVNSGIIVLFTPGQGGSNRTPVSIIARRWIWY